MPIDAHCLSESEAAKWRVLFDAVDADSDGEISKNEVEKVARAMGYPLSEAEAKMLISRCDLDKSGKVSFEEFSKALVNSGVKFRVATFLCGLFREMDANGDGQVTREEVKQLVDKAGAGNRIPDAKIDAFVAQADKDGDGQISFKEFISFLKEKLHM